MKINIFKNIVLFLSLFISFSIQAQENKEILEKLQLEINSLKSQIKDAKISNGESYDPLVPQSFAVDSKTQTIAAINHNENTVEILVRNNKGYTKDKVLLVDIAAGRHDIHAIYTPKSIAIYENHIIYLASNRDSSLVRVLNMKGEQFEEFRFNGAASAFSYDSGARRLYISGDNISGYNVFSIDIKDGFERINISNSPLFNYIKPKKADEIAKHDPYGIGLTAIAVATVFLALLVITLTIKGLGQSIISLQKRKANKQSNKESSKVILPKNISEISGEEFAAIAAALYMHSDELHDEENAILTINKIAKTYSPWSSKLYNMNVYKR